MINPAGALPRRLRAIPTVSCAVLACAVAVPSLAWVSAAVGDTAPARRHVAIRRDLTVAQGTLGASPAEKEPTATLAQCATAIAPQTERSATFAGEMTAVPGTARMLMRIELQERASSAEAQYHAVEATGLGLWHGASAPGVKTFAHLQQFTDLSAPAVYRGVIRFRWLNAKGRVIKSEELHTAACEQPAPGAEAGASGASAPA
ncbi:MAG TPA: hypothetical protein VKV16_00415 [Solirubrobacteraceae bacterium]|nr:hypothetical protein [Solirubrobacteraceae bacterium]